MEPTENWRPVPDYEGYYEVSDLGRVRRLAREDSAQGPRVLKGSPNLKGYLRVSLFRDGKRRDVNIHTLVLTAFVGPRPARMQGCHGDGNNQNNALSNLRWDTQSANILDSVAHGTHYEAKRACCSRGHALEGPNLVPSKLAQGRRNCVACARAGAYTRSRGLPFDQDLADRYFANIMSAALNTKEEAHD